MKARLELVFKYQNGYDIEDIQLQQIKEAMENLFHSAEISVQPKFASFLRIEIDTDDTRELNRQNLDNAHKKVLEILQSKLTEEKIIISEVPKYPIEATSISFKPISDVTLKNIHKFIKCDRFILEQPSKIIGNVLGLLLIQADRISIKHESLIWIDVIIKYLNGDRDLLDCQEELINNGLKDYARL